MRLIRLQIQVDGLNTEQR